MHISQRGGNRRLRNSRNKAKKTYRLIDGTTLELADLSIEDQKLVDRLIRNSKNEKDWNQFANYWMTEVIQQMTAQSLTRREIAKSIPFMVGQDLEQRLGIEAGMVQAPDYRAELIELIRSEFPTRKHFCVATGVSESLLSHVLSKRKHLAVDKLEAALARIGYELRFVRRKSRSVGKAGRR